jgi:hypothetical protein
MQKENPLTDRHQIGTLHCVGKLTLWAKVGVSESFSGAPQMGEILRFAGPFWFSGSRTGRTERRTEIVNGSNDAVGARKCLLGGLVSMQKRLGAKFPENT